MYRNYYGGGFVQKSPEQYVNDFQNLMSQYQNMHNKAPQNNQVQPQQANNSAISGVGTYQYVNEYSEVANAPVPIDGTAKLFINFNHKTMWAKKFENGKHTIQAYMFDVYNGENEMPVLPNKEESTGNKSMDFNNILERLEKLENKPKPRKKTNSEVVKDEL